MKTIEIVAMLTRVLGIYLIVKFFEYLYAVYQQLFLMHFATNTEFFYLKVVMIVVLSILLIVALVLVKFPTTVAKALYPGDLNAVVEIKSNFDDYAALISIAFGFYMLTWVIPDLVHNFLFLIYYKGQMDFYAAQFWEVVFNQIVTVVELFMSGYLILGSRMTARILRKFRS